MYRNRDVRIQRQMQGRKEGREGEIKEKRDNARKLRERERGKVRKEGKLFSP